MDHLWIKLYRGNDAAAAVVVAVVVTMFGVSVHTGMMMIGEET